MQKPSAKKEEQEFLILDHLEQGGERDLLGFTSTDYAWMNI